ncbi:GNAT family N-acetyltransferase [Chitinimonas arctica]|uniref:GNAT family N-acetyltransferase n=1 Tax=Chitinimonas arctica TaxID=2594795 RepID=A0A516SJ09_9NEIS|nr:GNAT family N-acetyltransferase [Chitinimonas arctica]QDQ28134.1 GNAT family N-acetyltransferase [Chitinimonas arctica]
MTRPQTIATIQTEHLILRAPTGADLAAAFEIFSDPATCRHNPAGPLRSMDAAADLLWRWQMHWVRHGFGFWVVCRREAPEEVLGFGGLSWRNYGDKNRLNLGFRFKAEAWGRGFATELGQAAIQLAFSELGEDEVWAMADTDNLAAQRLIAKLGLAPAGLVQAFPWLPATPAYRLAADEAACRHLLARLAANAKPEVQGRARQSTLVI